MATSKEKNASSSDRKLAEQLAKTKLFISYAWKVREQEIYQLAEFLQTKHFEMVWIDKKEMYASLSDRMTEGINKADIVVVCTSTAYADSENCMKELLFAVAKKKTLLPLNVQGKSFVPDDKILFHVKDFLRIDFLCDDDREKVYDGICNLLMGGGRIKDNEDYFKFKSFSVPIFTSQYYHREEDAEQILNLVKDVSKQPDIGCIVVHGEGGAGKSTLMSSLFSKDRYTTWILRECKLHVAIWLNCIRWRECEFDEDAITQFETQLARACHVRLSGNTTGIGEIVQRFDSMNKRVIFILDDVFNVNILVYLRSKCTTAVYCAVTRDLDPLRVHRAPPTSKELSHRLLELPPTAIVSMLANTFGLKKHLSNDQLLQVAERCCRLPLLAGLLAKRFSDCDTQDEYEEKFNQVMSEKLTEITVADGVDPEKDRVVKTVAQQLTFSINLMTEKEKFSYYVFVFFEPVERVSVADLASFWGTSQTAASALCSKFEKKGLVRSAGNNKYLVHQTLHEATIENARAHALATDFDGGPLIAMIHREVIRAISSHDKAEDKDRKSFDTALSSVVIGCLCNCSWALLERVRSVFDVKINDAIEKFSGSLNDLKFHSDDDGDTALSWAVRNENYKLASRVATASPNLIKTLSRNLRATPVMKLAKLGKIEMVQEFLSLCPDAADVARRRGQRQEESLITIAIETNSEALAHVYCDACCDDGAVASSGSELLNWAIERKFLNLARIVASRWPNTIVSRSKQGSVAILQAASLAVSMGHKGEMLGNGATKKLDAEIKDYMDLFDLFTKISPESLRICSNALHILLKGNIDNQTLLNFAQICPDVTSISSRQSKAYNDDDDESKSLFVTAIEHGRLQLASNFIDIWPECAICGEQSNALFSYKKVEEQRNLITKALDLFPFVLASDTENVASLVKHAVVEDNFSFLEFCLQQCPSALSRFGVFSGENIWRVALSTKAPIKNRLMIADWLTDLVFNGSSNFEDWKTETPLAAALDLDDNLSYFKALILRHPKLVYCFDHFGSSIMGFAIKKDNIEAVKYLIEKCPEISTNANSQGQTALHLAVRSCNFRMIEFVVKLAPQLVGLADKCGWTAALCAANLGLFDALKLLHKQKDSSFLAIDSNSGSSALILAIKGGLSHWCEKCAQGLHCYYYRKFDDDTCYCNCNYCKYKQRKGVASKCVDAIAFLVENFPQLLAIPDNSGKTPLCYAARMGVKGILDILLKGKHCFSNEELEDALVGLTQYKSGEGEMVLMLLRNMQCHTMSRASKKVIEIFFHCWSFEENINFHEELVESALSRSINVGGISESLRSFRDIRYLLYLNRAPDGFFTTIRLRETSGMTYPYGRYSMTFYDQFIGQLMTSAEEKNLAHFKDEDTRKVDEREEIPDGNLWVDMHNYISSVKDADVNATCEMVSKIKLGISGYSEALKMLPQNIYRRYRNLHICDEILLEKMVSAACLGNLEVIQRLYELRPEIAKYTSPYGETALSCAIEAGHTSVAAFIVEVWPRSLEITEKIYRPIVREKMLREQGVKPLLLACLKRNEHLVWTLLCIADPGTRIEKLISSCLKLIVKNEELSWLPVIQVLAEHQPKALEMPINCWGDTVLLEATTKRLPKVAKLLASKCPVVIGMVNSCGSSPLSCSLGGDSESTELRLAFTSNLLASVLEMDISKLNCFYTKFLLKTGSSADFEMVIKFINEHCAGRVDDDEYLEGGGSRKEKQCDRKTSKPWEWVTDTSIGQRLSKLGENWTGVTEQARANGKSPLLWATQKNDTNFARHLLQLWPNVFDALEIDLRQRTPFWWAAKRGNMKIVQMISKHAPTTMAKPDVYGRTPISIAASMGHQQVVAFLVEHSLESLAMPDNLNKWIALAWAAAGGKQDVVRYLVSSPTTRALIVDDDVNAAVLAASRNGFFHIAQCLTEALSQDVDVLPLDGIRTAISFAAEYGEVKTTELFADRFPAWVMAIDEEGRTALSWAAENGHVEIVKTLIKRYPEAASFTDIHGRTPTIWAAMNGHFEVVKLLAQTDGSAVVLERYDKNGHSALSWAAFSGHFEIVKYIAEMFPNLGTMTNSEGFSPLCWAAKGREIAIVEWLVERFPDLAISCYGIDGRTVITRSSEYGDLDVVKVLADRYPESLKFSDKTGETPMTIAAKNEHLSLVEYMAEQCPEALKFTDRRSRNALFVMLNRGCVDSAAKLSKKCPIALRIRDADSGLTPLSLCLIKYRQIKEYHQLAVSFAKLCPSALKVRDCQGRTAAIIAAQLGDSVFVELAASICPKSIMTRDNAGNSVLSYVSTMLAASDDENIDQVVDRILQVAKRFPKLIQLKNATGRTTLMEMLHGYGRVSLMEKLHPGYNNLAHVRYRYCNWFHFKHLKSSISKYAAKCYELLKELVNLSPQSLNIPDEYGTSPALFVTAHLTRAKFRNERYWWGSKEPRTSEKCMLEIIRLFIDSKEQFLLWAAEFGFYEIVRHLCENCNANANVFDAYGRSPLWHAAANGHLHVLQYLHKRSSTETANSADWLGVTPIRIAERCARWPVVAFLVGKRPLNFDLKTNKLVIITGNSAGG